MISFLWRKKLNKLKLEEAEFMYENFFIFITDPFHSDRLFQYENNAI